MHRLWPAAGMALLLQAAPIPFAPISNAAAATYYVRADGNDVNAGLANTAAGAWRTIGHANSRLVAGDVVSVVSLNAADTSGSANQINPSAHGDSLRAISYIGNVSAPETLPIPGFTISHRYIRVLGFRFQTVTDFGRSGSTDHAIGSVIQKCILNDALSFVWAERCKVDGCVMRLSAYSANTSDSPKAIALSSEAIANHYCWKDTLSNNDITIDPLNAQARGIYFKGYTNNCLLDRNRVTFWFDRAGAGTTGPPAAMSIQESFDCTFRDNLFTFMTRNDSNNGEWKCLSGRSSSYGHYFLRDTFVINPSGTPYLTNIFFGQASDPPCDGGAPPTYDCGRISSRYRLESCTFRMRNCDLEFDSDMDATSLKNCTFINDTRPGLLCNNPLLGSSIDHCTFVTYNSGSPALSIGQSLDDLSLSNNIFYKPSGSATALGITSGSVANLQSDYNLFANWGNGGAAGDRSIGWGGGTSRPGPGTSWAATGNSKDVHSGYVGPGPGGWGPIAFADTTSLARFDASLTSASLAALGRGLGGTNLGSGSVAVADIVPPAPVADLDSTMTSDHVVLLTWTAPGDDAMFGTATSYDIRYSTQPITTVNFSSATPAPGFVIPAPAGTRQALDMTGLTPGTTYYFALKASDEAGNWSAMSNVFVVTTTVNDGVSPAKISDLRNGP